MKPSLLIVPLIAAILTASIAAAAPPREDAATPAAVEEKAKATIIPKLEFRDVSSADALMMIGTMTGIKIFYAPNPKDDARITVSLSKIPASEALKYVTGLANLKFRCDKDGVHVVPLEANPPAPK